MCWSVCMRFSRAQYVHTQGVLNSSQDKNILLRVEYADTMKKKTCGSVCLPSSEDFVKTVAVMASSNFTAFKTPNKPCAFIHSDINVKKKTCIVIFFVYAIYQKCTQHDFQTYCIYDILFNVQQIR